MDGLSPSERVNQNVLKVSVWLTTLFTIMALAVGFLTSSQVILFDGIFNLVGIALTYLSIWATVFIKKKDDWNYPFGKATFEPFIAIVQYAVILYVCVSQIVSAVGVILSGGHAVNVASGVLYGLFSTGYNLAVCFYLKRLTKKQSTAITDVEIDQWKFSFFLGSGILLGFLISYGLSVTPLYRYTLFVDPVLTLMITFIFGKTAIVSMRTCVRELMQAAPSVDTWDVVKAKIRLLSGEYEIKDWVLRLGKVGQKLIIEIDFIVLPGSTLDSVLRQDQLRKELAVSFETLSYEKWININFTSDGALTVHMVEC